MALLQIKVMSDNKDGAQDVMVELDNHAADQIHELISRATPKNKPINMDFGGFAAQLALLLNNSQGAIIYQGEPLDKDGNLIAPVADEKLPEVQPRARYWFKAPDNFSITTDGVDIAGGDIVEITEADYNDRKAPTAP